ncbi:hypothetical protein AOG2_14320, partial [Geobacter sp. AOG2]
TGQCYGGGRYDHGHLYHQHLAGGCCHAGDDHRRLWWSE